MIKLIFLYVIKIAKMDTKRNNIILIKLGIKEFSWLLKTLKTLPRMHRRIRFTIIEFRVFITLINAAFVTTINNFINVNLKIVLLLNLSDINYSVL